MAFVTACISHISTLQKRAGLEKLTFLIYHDFLRLFRDFNHHEHYVFLRPIVRVSQVKITKKPFMFLQLPTRYL
jgi:hypothetical protein